eukprot:82197-Chlamydomonas_euryale.AAC.2
MRIRPTGTATPTRHARCSVRLGRPGHWAVSEFWLGGSKGLVGILAWRLQGFGNARWWVGGLLVGGDRGLRRSGG